MILTSGELDQLAGHIEQAETLIQRAAQQSEACQRLDAIPGIGPLTATALIAAIGNGEAFRKGREFAAWVGLVPRETGPEVSRSCSASASAATVICGSCSFRVGAQLCSLETSSAAGLEAPSWQKLVIAQPLQRRWRRAGQQAGHGWHGPYWPEAKLIGHPVLADMTGLQMAPG